MIRILKESFKNLPSWLKPYMNKGITSTLDDHGIDLYNATYTDASDITPRDPRWKTGGILVALIQDPDSPRKDNKFYMWGYNQPEADPYMWDKKRASQHSKSWIIDNAVKLGFIAKNHKPQKDRYRDPRKSYNRRSDGRHGKYAGQTYYDYTTRYKYDPATMPPGEWFSGDRRDKSGYVIPDPAKLVGKMYEFDLDNSAKVLDNYYKKLTRLKNRIFNLDSRTIGDQYSDTYESLLQYFGRASRDFLGLEKEINQILTKVGTDRWNKELQERGMTPEELFKEYTHYIYNKRDLDDYISDITSKLKKLENI